MRGRAPSPAALGLLLVIGLGCGSGTSSTSEGGGSTGSVGDASTSGDSISASGTSGGDSTSGTTAAPGPTAEECFVLESEEACEAAGCTQWAPARVVSMPSPDTCECGERYDVCLLFEGESVGTGSFRQSWVFESDLETVVELQRDYTRGPLGWTPCAEVASPPLACECFSGILDNCDNQSGSTD